MGGIRYTYWEGDGLTHEERSSSLIGRLEDWKGRRLYFLHTYYSIDQTVSGYMYLVFFNILTSISPRDQSITTWWLKFEAEVILEFSSSFPLTRAVGRYPVDNE